MAHVYATLHRVYAVPGEVRRRPLLYLGTPLLVAVVGTILAAVSPRAFWRAMAYLALHHFTKQQLGFVALYRAAAGETAGRRLDTAAVAVSTLVPVLHWHVEGRQFAWFMKGDFIGGLPSALLPAAWLVYASVLAAFVYRELRHALGGGPLRLGKLAVVVTTALTWGVGIVALDGDFAFTVTNVVIHGVAYTALTWHVTRGAREAGPWRGLAPFLGLPLLLAWLEELSWDGLVWHEHAALFLGLSAGWPALSYAPVVALLSVPQVTHYILDGFIWRLDGQNPGLREALFPRAL